MRAESVPAPGLISPEQVNAGSSEVAKAESVIVVPPSSVPPSTASVPSESDESEAVPSPDVLGGKIAPPSVVVVVPPSRLVMVAPAEAMLLRRRRSPPGRHSE